MAGAVVWLASVLETESCAGAVNLEVANCSLGIDGREPGGPELVFECKCFHIGWALREVACNRVHQLGVRGAEEVDNWVFLRTNFGRRIGQAVQGGALS